MALLIILTPNFLVSPSAPYFLLITTHHVHCEFISTHRVRSVAAPVPRPSQESLLRTVERGIFFHCCASSPPRCIGCTRMTICEILVLVGFVWGVVESCKVMDHEPHANHDFSIGFWRNQRRIHRGGKVGHDPPQFCTSFYV
jgi:hypothetical protein